MIYIQDNFLSADSFEWLNSRAELYAKKSLDFANNPEMMQLSKFYTDDKTAWDYAFKNLKNDLTIPQYRIGKNLIDIVNLIEEIIKQESQVDYLPKIDSVFLMFAIKGYKIKPHMDTKKASYDMNILASNFKSFVFSHTYWEDNWGGELCFNSTKVIPKPNRLVIYSSDELHWVEPVNEKATDHVRKIFGIRWGTESQEDVYNKV